MCIHVYAYVHGTCKYNSTNIHIHVYVHLYTCMYTCTYIYIHTCTHIYYIRAAESPAASRPSASQILRNGRDVPFLVCELVALALDHLHLGQGFLVLLSSLWYSMWS